jgi:urease accessory protein
MMSPDLLLRLMWLSSPALPMGGFSYSEGLESAVEAGLVHDEASTANWFEDQLFLGLARCELPVLAAAVLAWSAEVVNEAAIRALNDWHLHTRESAELSLQAQQMGRSMLAWLQACDDPDPRVAQLAALPPAPSWPLAYALALARMGAGPREGSLAYAFGWAENAMQSAVKAVPLGQRAGQRVLGHLVKLLPAAVDEALALSPSERQCYTPGLALLSSAHETQYSRLFRS